MRSLPELFPWTSCFLLNLFFVAQDLALCSGKRPHKHVEYFSTGEKEFFLPTTLIKVLSGGRTSARTASSDQDLNTHAKRWKHTKQSVLHGAVLTQRGWWKAVEDNDEAMKVAFQRLMGWENSLAARFFCQTRRLNYAAILQGILQEELGGKPPLQNMRLDLPSFEKALWCLSHPQVFCTA